MTTSETPKLLSSGNPQIARDLNIHEGDAWDNAQLADRIGQAAQLPGVKLW